MNIHQSAQEEKTKNISWNLYPLLVSITNIQMKSNDESLWKSHCTEHLMYADFYDFFYFYDF